MDISAKSKTLANKFGPDTACLAASTTFAVICVMVEAKSQVMPGMRWWVTDSQHFAEKGQPARLSQIYSIDSVTKAKTSRVMLCKLLLHLSLGGLEHPATQIPESTLLVSLMHVVP